MRHIVFVVGNYKNGGVPMRTTNLANEFAKKGYSSTILVTREIAEDVFFSRHEKVNIVSLKEYVSEHKNDKAVVKINARRKKRIKFLKRMRYISKAFHEWDKKLAAEIRGMRRSENLSVYMTNHPESLYIPFGISYFEDVFYGADGIGCKILYAERNAPELEFPQDLTEKKRLLKMLSRAEGAVLQTNDELAFFEGCLKNTRVIHNPVKANLPEPYSGERRKVTANFCRIAEQKNLPLMINAFLKLHEAHPEYKLEIYGNTVEKNEEELRDSLKAMISSLGAEDFIKILPACADVHSRVRDCAMFVSSSDFEGLSNSMIEAMAIGLPCVCTDCLGGGAREMIKDGENGLLVPMNDVQALSEAMRRIADDKELAKKCSENAAKVRTELSAQAIASKWINIIDKI